MRILVLVNGAHEHRPFYGAVGKVLEGRGHEVHYALDSHYTDVMFPAASLNANVHYFSDYFRQHIGRSDLPVELVGMNVSRMMFPDLDRFTYTRSRPQRDAHWYHSLAANIGHFFVELFDRFRFDSVVYENVSNSFSFVAWTVATKRHARYIGFVGSRLPGRTDVLDEDGGRDSRFERYFAEVRAGTRSLSSSERAWVRDYIDNFDQKNPDYIAKPHPFEANVVGRYFKQGPARRMLRAMRYQVEHRADADFSFQQGNPFIAYPEQFCRELARSAKLAVLRRSYYRTDIPLDVPYFAYPLQFHPESSTSVDGPAFIDEWANIEGIVHNLPSGYSLYIKDHKHAAARQPLDFYQKLGRLPNVVLVSPWYDAKRLMRHAQAVVCSTSTFGFEALILKKPVFVLGHPFYDFFPACHRLATFNGAHGAFVRHAELRASDDDIFALVAAYYLTSEEGQLDLLTMHDDAEVIQRVAGIIERKTREHRTETVGRQPTAEA